MSEIKKWQKTREMEKRLCFLFLSVDYAALMNPATKSQPQGN